MRNRDTGAETWVGVDCAEDMTHIPAQRIRDRAEAAQHTKDRGTPQDFRDWLERNAPAVGSLTDQGAYDRARRVVARRNGYDGDLSDTRAIARFVATIYERDTGHKAP